MVRKENIMKWFINPYTNNIADTFPEFVNKGSEIFNDAHEENRHYPINK